MCHPRACHNHVDAARIVGGAICGDRHRLGPGLESRASPVGECFVDLQCCDLAVPPDDLGEDRTVVAGAAPQVQDTLPWRKI